MQVRQHSWSRSHLVSQASHSHNLCSPTKPCLLRRRLGLFPAHLQPEAPEPHHSDSAVQWAAVTPQWPHLERQCFGVAHGLPLQVSAPSAFVVVTATVVVATVAVAVTVVMLAVVLVT